VKKTKREFEETHIAHTTPSLINQTRPPILHPCFLQLSLYQHPLTAPKSGAGMNAPPLNAPGIPLRTSTLWDDAQAP
jgi:hypothetical protein